MQRRSAARREDVEKRLALREKSHGREAITALGRWDRLSLRWTGEIFVVFVADVLADVFVWREYGRLLCRPRRAIGAGIGNGDLDVQMAQVEPGYSMDDVQHCRVRVPAEIDPPAIAKSNRIDDQRVAFPPAR